MNWGMLLGMLGSTLLSHFLGGDEEEDRQTTQTTETETDRRGYQSPMLGLADPLMFDTLLRNMQAYSGFGGVGSASPYISSILEMMQGQFPQLISGAGSQGPGWAKLKNQPGPIIRDFTQPRRV